MSELILHITDWESWDRARAAGPYRAESLGTEGFIHCSRPDQVTRVADALFAGRDDLVLLCIQPALLSSPVRWEGPGLDEERFPHVYGPLNLEAIVQVVRFPPGPDGRFTIPSLTEAAEGSGGLGFEDHRAPPESAVRTMFDGLVERYDLLNGLLSLGLDRWWRRATVRALRAGPGGRVLDLGCGTGDLALASSSERVVGLDLSLPMLLRARAKTGRAPGRPLALVQGSAFHLPFAAASFDGAMSGFVLRNVSDLQSAFEELARVVRDGGRLAMVDITGPRRPALRRLFDAYFGTIAPAAGRLVGKETEYRYLAGSLSQLPPADQVCRMLSRAGFGHPRARPLTGGVVTLFTATRSDGGATEHA